MPASSWTLWNQALHDRRPVQGSRLVHHSDRGSQGGFEAVVATRSLSADRRNRSSASAGVFQLEASFRGRRLRAAATAAISLALLHAGDQIPLGSTGCAVIVSVLVGAALPWAGRGITEADSHARLDLEARVLGHLSSLIPSQRPAQLLGQHVTIVREMASATASRHDRRVGARSSREPRGHGPPCAAGIAAEWRVVRSTKVPIAELPRTQEPGLLPSGPARRDRLPPPDVG